MERFLEFLTEFACAFRSLLGFHRGVVAVARIVGECVLPCCAMVAVEGWRA